MSSEVIKLTRRIGKRTVEWTDLGRKQVISVSVRFTSAVFDDLSPNPKRARLNGFAVCVVADRTQSWTSFLFLA